MTNRLNQTVFGEEWLSRARFRCANGTWVDDVMANLDQSGQAYLATLRLWFNAFPATANDKNHLRQRLEDFNNVGHLGAVNELSWWRFMEREGIRGSVVPTSDHDNRPDFKLDPPADCFVEVSTLNVSNADRLALMNGESVPLNHAKTFERVAGKFTDKNKLNQLRYAVHDQGKACVLALFDYTTWSAYGIDFAPVFGEFLLGEALGFKGLPTELSALLYLKSHVLDGGRIALSRLRSAMFYNPLAIRPLAPGSFPTLRQFSCELRSREPMSPDAWLFL